jgi:protein SCO1/2
MSEAAGSKSTKEERLFLWAALVVALFFGAGGLFVIVSLNHREKAVSIKSEKPRELVDFSLTASSGQTVTRADLNDKILAVSFLFTSCSLTCPVVSRSMAEIQQLTTNAADVRLLSLTVDPRSDTAPVLAKWGAKFGADTNRWFMLTGDKATLNRVIGTSFLDTETNNPFNSMPGNFTGTERIAVVDPHGHVIRYFDGLRLETPAAVAAEITRVRKENHL